MIIEFLPARTSPGLDGIKTEFCKWWRESHNHKDVDNTCLFIEGSGFLLVMKTAQVQLSMIKWSLYRDYYIALNLQFSAWETLLRGEGWVCTTRLIVCSYSHLRFYSGQQLSINSAVWLSLICHPQGVDVCHGEWHRNWSMENG